tara:strand:+ start:302 stop:640 length:339 start_codon:yes stop_codon:yes gene_type:complete
MTKKTSFLQKSIIKRIDDFCGIEKLVSFLNRLQNNKSPSDKLRVLTLIHYYQSLYLYYVPVEDDCIDYRDSALDTVAFLENYKNTKDADYVCFLINLISFGLDYTVKIKKLA